VFSLPATGWLVRSYGWPVPFYAFGAVGLVWAVVWFTKVGRRGPYDAPPEAPRTIPWAALLRTPAVWAIIINHFCHNWALYVMLAWLPTYFKTTFGISLANAGLYSAAPWLTSFLVANVAGSLADRLLRRGVDPTTLRKLMQGLGLIGGATFLLLLRGAGSIGMGVFLMSCSTGVTAFCLAGFAPNSFDIAPRYADVIWGISNTFATLPGIIGVAVTGWLVDRTGTFTAPFILVAAINVLGALVYFAIGSGRRQIE
jgi:ACS family sodium-dependent inorganic phosphate cotransporter